jgi:very-short-patch-repair endonuclease
VEAAERWPNSLNSRIVMSRADRRLTSVAEARTWHFFYEHHIARPEPQVEVHDEAGRLLGIVDFLWREHGVFLEFDGKIKYERFRRPGETLDDYLMREKRREEQICQVTGWVCIRITWADIENPVRTANRIRSVLEGRTKPAA